MGKLIKPTIYKNKILISKFNKMKKKVSIISILLIIISFFTFSCNREESKSENLSIDSFAERHVQLTNKIYDILSNKYLNDKNFIFNGDIITKFKNEKELDDYLLKIGFNENEKTEFLSLMREDKILLNKFSIENEEFKTLDKISKEKIIFSKIDFYNEKINPISNNITARSCAEQWNVDISRCKRNYALETGLSIIGGIATGGVGGLIGFAGATAHWTFCLKDARDDYYDCQYWGLRWKMKIILPLLTNLFPI